jgi:hypothetical protein
LQLLLGSFLAKYHLYNRNIGPRFEACLNDMADCNVKDEGGMGLIHWAADRGSCDIVRILGSILPVSISADKFSDKFSSTNQGCQMAYFRT